MDPVSQVLVFQDNILSHHVETDTPGTSFPDTSPPSPVVLYNKESNNISLGIERDVPAFPALPNLVSVENDATLAKSACAVGYAYRRKIESYARCAGVVDRCGVRWLAEVVGARLERLLETTDKCKALTRMAEAQVALFERSQASQLRALELFSSVASDGGGGGGGGPPSSVESWRRRSSELASEDAARCGELRRRLDELAPAVEQLNRRHVADHRLVREWKEAIRGAPPLEPAAAK